MVQVIFGYRNGRSASLLFSSVAVAVEVATQVGFVIGLDCVASEELMVGPERPSVRWQNEGCWVDLAYYEDASDVPSKEEV